MIIRPFVKEDLEHIFVLENMLYKNPWSMKDYENELTNNYSFIFIAEEQGVIIGYYGMWVVSDNATITKVSVHPSLQNKGIGKILMQDMLNRAMELGALYISLEVRVSNASAIHVYESFGFKHVGIRKHYYQDGEDAYAMVKYFPGGEDYETIYIRN